MESSMDKRIRFAANKVKMNIVANKVTMDLYQVYEPVLDLKKTLNGVALIAFSHRTPLNTDQARLATEVLEDRFDEWLKRVAQ